MLCLDCGNEIPDGKDCPICQEAQETVLMEALPEEEAELETRFCLSCGNEVPEATECAICAAAASAAEAAAEAAANAEAVDDEVSEPETRFCADCGNEVPADRPCGVCELGRAPGGSKAPTYELCTGCGNEVENVHECPICLDGKSTGKHAEEEGELGPACPNCKDPLEEQDWDGALVLMCPTCQGCLFEPGGLEQSLRQLREGCKQMDLRQVLEEFRDRRGGAMPRVVRYRPCPVCGTPMTRRNHASVSGIMVDVCGKHGTWVDQPAFAAIAEFVARGGDKLAEIKRNSR